MEEKIIKILELVQMKDEGIVEFTAESKALIHEAAEECRKLPFVPGQQRQGGNVQRRADGGTGIR